MFLGALLCARHHPVEFTSWLGSQIRNVEINKKGYFWLYESAKAAETKYHRLCGLSNRNLFSHSSGGWKSNIKVLAGLASPEASLLGLQTATFLLCPYMAFPLCTHIPGVSSSFYKDISPLVLLD